MIRLEWKDCRLTAEGTQVVLEKPRCGTCWRLEARGLGAGLRGKPLYGLLLAERGRCGTGSGLHGPAGRGTGMGGPAAGGRPVC